MHDWTLDEQQSEEVIRHALDLGINFFLILQMDILQEPVKVGKVRAFGASAMYGYADR